MRVETAIVAPSIQDLAQQARRLEEMGYDSVITPEAGHDPFLPLMIIAEHTQRLKFGTGVAIAFPRSPFVTAQMAWDLQRYSGGRFLLGLGTQVKGHNERRYSTPWPSPPGPRMREYILCLKAIFKTFQTSARPDFTGKHYQFTLISPFFSPGPNPNGDVPVYISAVNKYNCRLVGELCDGIRMHGFNTLKYTKEVIIPAIEEGAKKAGRRLSDIDLVGGTFLVTGKNEEEVERAKAPVRQQISFYASTRAYFPVLETHGWEDVGQRLFRLSMEGRWPDMANEITDEMLEEFAVVGTYDELLPKLKERFAGLVTTLDFGFGIRGPEDQERLGWMVQELKKA
ncbi:MAG TPA: TIGR03617 family F420-dependent LLM class oxidoreductase [Dehalococcoidia bacterium]|nr:TIGR03617 family F420-dependent LLM class oxidoreductase [Dehalococcoidia bacterium]